MKKYILYILLIIIILLGIWQYELIHYGLMQGRGQLKILLTAKPINDLLADSSFPDSLKAKLLLIREIKKFAIDSLGIKPSDSYEKYYDQQGKPILWTLTACEPFRLVAKEWDFPLIGNFSYKGFFDYQKLENEEQALKLQGFDTEIDEVSAWSTLGYLNDPVLSTMLRRKVGSLANLIIHELTHGTLFIKNDLTYNENLANFVGNEGAIRFLKYKYGRESAELTNYLAARTDRKVLNDFLLKSAKRLDSLYQTFDSVAVGKPDEQFEKKKALKDSFIKNMISSLDTVHFQGNNYKGYFENYLPNNAFFIGFLTYNEKQNMFEEEFKQKFGEDFKSYMTYLKDKYER